MPKKEPPSDLPVHSFASSAEFESFLEHSHETLPGFYLKLAKKSSGIPTISGADAVEIALCFGWIDGRANGLDDDWWTVRFTPRRAKSIWSQKNVKTVARLQEQGRMQPAGMAAVDAAKADGRWERAYAGPATITVPTDLTEALASKPPASAFFDGLNKTDRYSVLWRIETASQQSRGKRINAIVQMLAAGTLPGATTKPATKTIARIARGVAAQNKEPKTLSGKRKLAEGEVVTDSTASNARSMRPRRAGLRERSG